MNSAWDLYVLSSENNEFETDCQANFPEQPLKSQIPFEALDKIIFRLQAKKGASMLTLFKNNNIL